MEKRADSRPLVLHVVYRFDTGGLENGVVNLINRMPGTAYRHAVLALTEVTGFKTRVLREDVEFHALHKPPGHGIWLYPKLYRLFRQLRPAIVHTRNLAALECTVPAWAAGVPVRIHGEHGRDVDDLDGSNTRYQRMRRLYSPFVHRYVALSQDLEGYLRDKVGIKAERIVQIYNGVDTARFAARAQKPALPDCPFDPARHLLIGTVGRMQAVKDQLSLAKAFAALLQAEPTLRERLRLVIVGDGPMRATVQGWLQAQGLADLAWLPGDRSDVATLMQAMDIFVLPSLAEGISNTILEAMAAGLPVLASRVGGNAELLEAGETGLLFEAGDVAGLTTALQTVITDEARRERMGRLGRERALRRFSLDSMVANYQSLYDNERIQRGSPGLAQPNKS
ncbi:TIGR03088 family PEP-CTERM/XrtA system glycosyltransferase [Paucibacter sp. APW11]|uniref:TIGR03088 family PEP-CTERM/XrtA system glycosyltransferase n=1 Tax=Roseateles aquae TaxID=3077235 RepID=A0ABU3P757_9BURK|nr:TIGR03088 family PEP-CTERM/XrtA system glycosyltransferase [Paucibacter sp. APW11]MDT8997943.1 TIGR03088 family PEP-CTERM/XrtA system glycosyltransferase [Paucibacter sp. APW11]